MRAIEITRFGPPEVLCETQRPDPVPAPGELLIAVQASGVNRPDVLQRKGLYPMPPGVSDLPGLEVAGTVAGGAPEDLAAAGLALGDAVCALVAGGGYAERCVAPAGQCLPVPHGPEHGRGREPARDLLHRLAERLRHRRACSPARRCWCRAAPAASASPRSSWPRHWVRSVIVTAGSDDKCAACVALGADHAINYRTQDFVAETKRLTAGRGADVVLDMVAGDYVGRELECLADDGRLAIIAMQGGTRRASRRRPGAAQAADDQRLDAAAALGGLQDRARARAARARLAAARGRPRQARDPPGVPGRARRPRRMR